MSDEEWFNELLPHQNTMFSVQMAAVRVNATPTHVDLRTLFGNPGRRTVPSGSPLSPTGGVYAAHLDPGHFWAIRADGANATGLWKAYMHISTAPSGTVNRDAISGSGVAWPIMDGETLKGKIVGGLQSSPSGGYAPTSVSPSILTFSCPTNSGTGWLRIQRSTLREGQPGGAFGAP